EVKPQDRAAVAKVRPQVEQVVIRISDQLDPEGHDLHVAARARARHGVFSEIAFVLDQGDHELRIESGPRRFVLNGDKEIATHLRVGYLAGEPRGHVRQPRRGLEVGGEYEARSRIVAHAAMERRLHLGGERFLELRTGASGYRRKR